MRREEDAVHSHNCIHKTMTITYGSTSICLYIGVVVQTVTMFNHEW